MTLIDTSPLVALFIEHDKSHARCRAITPTLSSPFITTWACIAEAMYLLGRYGGHSAQDKLWAFIMSNKLIVHAHPPTEFDRMRFLMRQYSDTPMDFADASLVAAAETLNEPRIFTLDSDFNIYRLHGHQPFQIQP